jgi:hypothetical protein
MSRLTKLKTLFPFSIFIGFNVWLVQQLPLLHSIIISLWILGILSFAIYANNQRNNNAV